MEPEFVTVFRNRKLGIYRIQPMAEHPLGAPVEFGEPTIVKHDELELSFVDSLLQSLSNSRTQEYSSDCAIRISADERAAFDRAHDAISVRRYRDGSIRIMPLERDHGGYAGYRQDELFLDRGASPEELFRAIRDAFSRSSLTKLN